MEEEEDEFHRMRVRVRCELYELLHRTLLGWLRAQANRRKNDRDWQLALEEATMDSRSDIVLEMERKSGQRFWNAHYVSI